MGTSALSSLCLALAVPHIPSQDLSPPCASPHPGNLNPHLIFFVAKLNQFNLEILREDRTQGMQDFMHMLKGRLSVSGTDAKGMHMDKTWRVILPLLTRWRNQKKE